MANSKKIIIPLAIVGVLGVAGAVSVPLLAKTFMSRMTAEQTRESVLVERRTLVESVSASGTVTSVKEKDVVAALSAVKIDEVFVEVGDTVKRGDPLCSFDTEDLEYDLAMTEDSLGVSGGLSAINVNAAARSLNDALLTRNIELERADKDTAKAWEDYIEAQDEYEKAERDLNSARQTTAEKNGELELRRRRLEEAKARAEELSAGAVSSPLTDPAYQQTVSEFLAAIGNSSDIVPNEGVTDRISSGDSSVSAYTDFEYTAKDDISNATNQSMVNSYITRLSAMGASAVPSVDQASLAAVTNEINSLTAEIAEWEAKYAAAKQNEASADAMYKQAKVSAESMFTAYEQRVRLTDDTRRNMDSAVAAQQDALRSANLNASLTGASEKRTIRQLNAQIKEGTAISPMNGVVTAVSAVEGNMYAGTVIATINDVSGYEITSEINEYDIGKLAVGQRVVIKTNGTGDEELDGEIIHINPRATNAMTSASALGGVSSVSSGIVTYRVRIRMLDDNELVRMDMTAKLSIIIEEAEDALTVPYDAIIEDEDGKFFVEVVTSEAAEGEAPETKRVEVEKGIESDYYIEVLSDELKEGDKILLPENSDITDLYEMLGIETPMDGM